MIVEPLPWRDPIEAAGRLRPLGGLAFLDSAMRHPRLGRYSYVAAAPFGLFTVAGGRAFFDGQPLPGPPLAALAALLARFTRPRVLLDGPPFQGGAIGVLAYDVGETLEPLPATPDAVWGRGADIHLGFYDTVLGFDHESRAAWLFASGLPAPPDERPARARRRADAVRAALEGPPPPEGPAPHIGRSAWASNFTPETYEVAVADVIEAILGGEIFQANIAQRFMAPLPSDCDPFAFYRRLRQTNPAPYAAFLDQGSRSLASSSPELFLALDGRRVETRPIKGTARRAADPDEDRRIADQLAASAKDRAENVMIVDLLRNDLSRVCDTDSVAVPQLWGIESYAGVHHLVSQVTGRLRPGLSAIDLIAAAFPGGSVTGAPKPQAMRVIARTEGETRGAYCGAIAALGFDGGVTSNIAIRTVTFQGGRAIFQVGGGITALSDPGAEYQETLDKAERIFAAFAPADETQAR